MLMTLIPNAKTVGIIYCSGEANSKYQVDVVTKCLEEKNITVKVYPFADSNDVQAITTKAVAECDAIYIPTDNTAADSAEIINNIAEPAKKPIIAGEEGICKGCGVATLTISYYDIGVAAANQAYDILVNGKDPVEWIFHLLISLKRNMLNPVQRLSALKFRVITRKSLLKLQNKPKKSA